MVTAMSTGKEWIVDGSPEHRDAVLAAYEVIETRMQEEFNAMYEIFSAESEDLYRQQEQSIKAARDYVANQAQEIINRNKNVHPKIIPMYQARIKKADQSMQQAMERLNNRSQIQHTATEVAVGLLLIGECDE